MMILYNTTFIVPQRRFEEWLKWAQETYIPFMRRHNFNEARLMRVLYNSVERYEEDDSQKEDNSFSIQFQIESLELLRQWEINFENAIFQNLYERFSADILTFSTVLESLS